MPRGVIPPATNWRARLWQLALAAGLLAALCLAWRLQPLLMQTLHPDPAQQSLLQARRIYNACQAFAAVRGHLPDSLPELVPDFLPDHHALEDPAHPGELGYFYFGLDQPGGAGADAVFLAGKAAPEDRRVVVRFNGQGREEFLPEKWLRRQSMAGTP